MLSPASLEEALGFLAERPEAVPIAGGTDLMVALNFRRLRPKAMIDLTRLPELQEIRRDDDEVFLGAGVTYARIVHAFHDVPTLAQAARSVGSPQIRARGTVGGNLGTDLRPGTPSHRSRSTTPASSSWRPEGAAGPCRGTTSCSAPSGPRAPPTS